MSPESELDHAIRAEYVPVLRTLGFKGRETSMKCKGYGDAYWYVDYTSLGYKNQEGITAWVRVQFYDPQVDCLLLGKKMGKSAGICALSFSITHLARVSQSQAVFVPDLQSASSFGKEIADVMQHRLGGLIKSVPNELALLDFMLSNPLLQSLAPATLEQLVMAALKSYEERGKVLKPEITTDLTRRARNLAKLSNGLAASDLHGKVTVAQVGS